MASSQRSPGLKLSSKRPWLSSNYDKCIKCQTLKKKRKTSFETQLQNVSDISIQKATEVIPARLQQFLRWLFQSQRAFEREGLPIENHKDLNESVLKENEARNILDIFAIGQDIVSCNSGGRTKIPKYVGLGLVMKTMVQGKEMSTMLNHHGHWINYWECEQSDTNWAEISLNQFEEEDGCYQATLPLNIVSGTFVQSAADNADYLLDSVDGNQSIHVMSMAFYQGSFALDPKNLGFPTQHITKVKRRVLNSVETKLYERLRSPVRRHYPPLSNKSRQTFFNRVHWRERSYKVWIKLDCLPEIPQQSWFLLK